ncbi:hypothetical protein BpHYR1_007070 [Brachionus plicatilis]|uniref:Uncharacterized protein n=1 Tax=Brachionus plicatilis TaxID=10195 RepID=A0A3M7PLH5_BRAPC|nr:hypothetical protein BpHYR1_007070 [Brachionus plicatilis]
MLSETQEIRKRPFSVNDINRRTREVKIYNTTTITTTSTSTATDSIVKSTDMYNSDNYGSFAQRNDCRSKSAQGVINVNREYKNDDTCYANITTNTSISLPIKRKIRFIYGENQQENQQQIKGAANENKSNQQASEKTNCDCEENFSKFPYEKKEDNMNEEYDNFDFRKNCSMKVKDVEVECEIDEDPAIFEGSEGYVKKLINKIQQQYKNPETVHIKITRRQKPKMIDKNDGKEHAQVVKKEYYTIKNLRRQKKSSSISSFIDQTNIPYIDEESLNDSRNSWME